MIRTPPAEVLRDLRKEVGFGCPVNGCREAILTWHHFDPPWREENHHRPEGMIALCRRHAGAADGGLYTKAQLREWKNSPCSVEDVKTRLPWVTRDFLIRLGGCYSGGESVPLFIQDKPIISLSRDQNGMLLVSADFRTVDGNHLANLRENIFEADPAEVYDLTVDTAPTSMKIWFAEREIGMELSFRRITLEKLDEVLTGDRARSQKRLPPEIKDLIGRSPTSTEIMRGMAGRSGLPDEVRDAFLSGDPTGNLVRKYAEGHLDLEEGTVPFLDFRTLHVHSGDRHVIVKDGLASSIFYSASFGNARGGFNL